MNLFCAFLTLGFSLVAAQPCIPTSVSPSFTSLGISVRQVSALTTHVLVVGGNTSSGTQSLYAVEYATGIVVVADSSGLVSRVSLSPDRRFVAVTYFLPSRSLLTMEATGANAVQLNPPAVTPDIVAFEFVFFSPNSQWAVFCDQQSSPLSGVYVSLARESGSAMRVSLPSQVNGTIRLIVISPDSTQLVYVYQDPTDLSNLASTIFLVSLVDRGSSAAPITAAAVGVSAVAFSPNSQILVYTAGQFAQAFSVDVVGTNNVQLSTHQGITDFVSNPFFTSDGSRIIFDGILGPQAVLSWYAAVPGVAMSHYVISNNSVSGVLGAKQVIPGTSVFISVWGRDSSDETAVWAKDAAQNSLSDLVRLSPDATTFTPTQSVLISGFVGGNISLVAFIGDFVAQGNSDAFYNIYSGPSTAAVQVTPPNSFASSLTPLRNGEILMRVNDSVAYVVTPGETARTAISREQDNVVTIFAQPNSVSALYTTTVPNEMFVSCVVPPTVVSSGSVANFTGITVPGHLVVNSGSTVVASAVSVSGTLVINGGTLLVKCKAGTQVVVNATWIVGNFDALMTSSCPPGCSSSVASSQSSSTLSVTVNLACAVTEKGLTDGQIAGIVVGSVCAGILVAVGVAIARVVFVNAHERKFNREHAVELRSVPLVHYDT